MDHDEFQQRLRQIREGRVAPIPVAKTKAAKSTAKAIKNLEALFEGMTPEEKEAFVKSAG